MQADYSKTPEATEAKEIVQRTTAAVNGLKVTTAAEYEIAAGYLGKIKAGQKHIEALRTKITVPLNAALKAVNDLFRGPAAELLAHEVKVKQAMLAFQNEQDRLRRIEQAKADEEARKQREKQEAAERKAREDAEALRKQAEEARAAGEAEAAAKLESKAERKEDMADTKAMAAASTVAPVIHREAPKVGGVSTSDVWKFSIENSDLVPREYLIVDESKIRKVVQALKGDTKIAGVKVWSEKALASRAA